MLDAPGELTCLSCMRPTRAHCYDKVSFFEIRQTQSLAESVAKGLDVRRRKQPSCPS